MKNNMKAILTILFIFAIFLNVFSQNEKKFIREGNKLYNQKNYNDAEVKYRKSLLKDSTYKIGNYNLANSLYKQKNFEEATRFYSNLAEKETDKSAKSKIYHNLGNSYLQTKEYEKGIEAYKQALKNNPTDIDTKYNLSYAMQMLKQQQQNKDNKNDKKDKDKKNEDKKDDKNKDDQNKDKQQNQDKKQQEQKQKQLKKEEAERMLEALKNDEKKTLDKVKKQKAIGVRVKTEKDW
jgi:tetratricopeptide (TPR) repeat protein